MTFPQYRKYKNDKSYFKITSKEDFEELKLIGKRYQVFVLKAKILPERVLIGDLLQPNNDYCDEVTAQEYEDKLAWAMENLQIL